LGTWRQGKHEPDTLDSKLTYTLSLQVTNTEANIVSKDGATEFEEILTQNFTLYRNSDGSYQEKETQVAVVQVDSLSKYRNKKF